MTNSYKKESRSRHKKLLVPLVALLLCAAAMVGVGYAALTSDVTNTGNVITTDGITLSISDGSSEAAGIFTSTIVYGANNLNGTKTYTVKENYTTPYLTDDNNSAIIAKANLRINVTADGALNLSESITQVGTIPEGMVLSLVYYDSTTTLIGGIAQLKAKSMEIGDNTFVVCVVATLGPTFNPGNIAPSTDDLTFSVNIKATV